MSRPCRCCIVASCLTAIALIGCREENPALGGDANKNRNASTEDLHRTPPAARFKITCTTGMITDTVRRIASDRADVLGIIGEGVDPHLYQATRSDVLALTSADVVYYNGLLLEGRMTDTFIKVARQRPVYAVTDLIDESILIVPAALGGHPDPHVWMDPSLWSICAKQVAITLGNLDPPRRETFVANHAKFAEELTQLDAYARKCLDSVPERSRVLVTAHDAFRYFARAYGMEVHGIQGISTESEAGIADINRLVDLLVTREVKAVFIESSVSDKNIRALIEGAAARGHTVTIGGTLYSDAMGKPGTYEGTYVGMIDHNVTTITRSLGGDAPIRGLHGKLSFEK
ncbi:MAG: zinc ABC transporter substrate-binding protein [Phycisphaerae bacterium]|nr:zinc ABC transporter substrate-binding protein [Phycisphaerae bacterium]